MRAVTVEALATDETLLLLKIGFLVLLYGFIIFVARSATKDIARAPEESIVLGAREASALRAEHGARSTRLLIVAGPGPVRGETLEIARPAVVGRDSGSDISLARDEYASARHARLEPRPDGLWVRDLDSTNGTFVNGERIAAPRLLQIGDVVRVGETELQVQP